MALLLLSSCCILGDHPILDFCHRKNQTLRSSIQKMLALSITILCACILNWSSFVFAAVFQHQTERWPQWNHTEMIQNNLGTGMLAVNGAMLLGIVLSVIHCGAPIRAELVVADHRDRGDDSHDDDREDSILQMPRSDAEIRECGNENDQAILDGKDENDELQETCSSMTSPRGDAGDSLCLNRDDHTTLTIIPSESAVKNDQGSEYRNMNELDAGHPGFCANLSMKRIKRDMNVSQDEKQVSLLSSSNEVCTDRTRVP